MLKSHARTDVGKRRRHNEDSLLSVPEAGLFVVADGVGGRKAGELASAITVNTFQSYGPRFQVLLEEFTESPSRDRRNAILTLLDEAANESSKRVYEAAQATARQGMTTTLVAGVIGGGAAFIVYVGDSRAYLVREGELRQLTEDHSMVNELIRTGAISPDEASTNRYRNVITRAVGLYPSVRADTLAVDLVRGDRILLCSDGLSDMIQPAAILDGILDKTLPESVDLLIQRALDAGGKDNVTVILVEPEALLEPETVSARAKILESLFLFDSLPYHARLRVGRILSERYVTPGEHIVRRGDLGDTFFVVVQGEVSVLVGSEEVAVLREGEHFGELALVENQPRSASIKAKGFGLLLCIDRDTLREFCIREPSLGNQILWKLVATLGQRLRAANQKTIRETP